MAEGLYLPAQWFVQHGFMLQTAYIMLDFFNFVFWPSRHVKPLSGPSQLQQIWLSLSPDLNLSDFILWGLLQEMFP